MINLKGLTVLINCEIIACIAFMFQIAKTSVCSCQSTTIHLPAAFLTAMTYLIIVFLLKLFMNKDTCICEAQSMKFSIINPNFQIRKNMKIQ